MEFLSNPWVMVQVTHFPSVLHQWLVAAYAEMLRFQQQISDFHYLPYPESCKEAVALLLVVESVKGPIARCLHILKLLICEETAHSVLFSRSSPLNGLQKDLSAILCKLEKVRSEKGQNVIKSLKRLCWNDSSLNCPLLTPVESYMKCAFYDSKIYYRKFWENGFKGHFFLPAMYNQPCSRENCRMCSKMDSENRKERREFEKYFEMTPLYKDKNLLMQKMGQFFDDHFKQKFPDGSKESVSFLAHLVDKEVLFLQWKFEQIDSRFESYLYPNVKT